MLKPACRRFRARFEPGEPHGHRRDCPACDDYAAALEGAGRAGAGLPLPPGLERRLRALGHPPAASEEIPPVLTQVPRLPLPSGLAGRLRAIARRPAPPVWARSPWQSLAASFALALLVQGVLGNPVARAQPLAAAVSDRVTAALEETADRKQGLEETWIAPAVDSARRRWVSTQAQAAAWAEALTSRARRLFGGDPEI